LIHIPDRSNVAVSAGTGRMGLSYSNW
jgi:hypothetical protein